MEYDRADLAKCCCVERQPPRANAALPVQHRVLKDRGLRGLQRYYAKYVYNLCDAIDDVLWCGLRLKLLLLTDAFLCCVCTTVTTLRSSQRPATGSVPAHVGTLLLLHINAWLSMY